MRVLGTKSVILSKTAMRHPIQTAPESVVTASILTLLTEVVTSEWVPATEVETPRDARTWTSDVSCGKVRAAERLPVARLVMATWFCSVIHDEPPLIEYSILWKLFLDPTPESDPFSEKSNLRVADLSPTTVGMANHRIESEAFEPSSALSVVAV